MTLEPEKITIVEGPPPIFEPTGDPWIYALNEGPVLKQAARCLLRTMNGPALLKRCQTAWAENRDVFLEYRESDGYRKESLILAARKDEVDEGQLLQLWIQLETLPEAAFDDNDFGDDIDEDEPTE